MPEGKSIFEIEKQLSIEEKIQFIDEMKDGVGSYLLNILTKWENEKDELPKDQYGNPKSVSVKAWIKRNDPRGIIDTKFNIGHYTLFGTHHTTMSTVCQDTKYSNLEYIGEHIVHQWFHDLCEELYWEERKYFKEHDPVQLKLRKIREYADKRILFDNEELNEIIFKNKEDVPEERLDKYIEAYERIENEIKRISEELKNI